MQGGLDRRKGKASHAEQRKLTLTPMQDSNPVRHRAASGYKAVMLTGSRASTEKPPETYWWVAGCAKLEEKGELRNCVHAYAYAYA